MSRLATARNHRRGRKSRRSSEAPGPSVDRRSSAAREPRPIDRIPGEFAYWKNIESRGAQRTRKVLELLFSKDPQLPDEVVRAYAHSYYDADPVAEAFVEEVYLERGQVEGRKLLDRALENGVGSIPGAPRTLRALVAEVEEPPAWLDREQAALGARVFRRFGTRMFSFAGAITLHGYQENSVAKPLAFTGAYTGESANRRFLETAAFWIDVSKPGALLAGGRGVETALRVRLMHVFLRKRLLAHPGWDLDAWGVPISQGDALLTLMGGSFVPGVLLRLLGYRTSRREIEAMMHFWRYVGHLMGVQPRWYPSSLREALGLMFTAEVKSVNQSGEDVKDLALSYVRSYAPTDSDEGLAALAKWLEHGLQLGYTSLFLPPRTYRNLGLPAPGVWRLHPFLQAPVRFAVESLRRRSKGVDDWVDARARRETKSWLESRLGERKAAYHAAETFTR